MINRLSQDDRFAPKRGQFTCTFFNISIGSETLFTTTEKTNRYSQMVAKVFNSPYISFEGTTAIMTYYVLSSFYMIIFFMIHVSDHKPVIAITHGVPFFETFSISSPEKCSQNHSVHMSFYIVALFNLQHCNNTQQNFFY